MSATLERATALLFPPEGRQALDVKFFFAPSATVEALAQQIIVCFDAMGDNARVINRIDRGLTS
ncbi:MAG TPA: hypothetical protein DDZ81_10255 [Acetobacteraceae bacterium]|jgi:hypothetical protein|nr:hypothetical protein [Acetobacteraceae bacterium]